MTPNGPFIAVDWGTTNRRAYLLGDAGQVTRAVADDRGLLAVPPDGFPDELASLRNELGDFPALIAGMAGSARGWVNVPYVDCPATIDDLAAGVAWVEPGRTAIVPGVADPGCDVMRGEEVQLLGAQAAGIIPREALACQPGTHCKWARLDERGIRTFSTAMTGELFALLQSHSLLSDLLHGTVSDGEDFRAGVQDGLDGSLTTALFRVRAAALLGKRKPEQSAAYTSGLLIGHDVAGQALRASEVVHILAGRSLGELYASAVALAGGRAVQVDSQAAFVAGMTQIRKAMHS